MSENLDTMLSQPLPEMPDNGFSNRVTALLELQHLRRDRLITEIYVGLVVLAALVLPFTPLGAAIASAAFTGMGMGLIILAAGAVLLFSLSKRSFHISL